jgi:hypothetical protein
MAKYLLLKHYRGAPAPLNNVPMEWSPAEWCTTRPGGCAFGDVGAVTG